MFACFFARFATLAALRQLWRLGLSGLALSLVALHAHAVGADFLPPAQAFAFSAQAQDDGTLRLRWRVAPGYHIYRDRTQVSAQGATLAALALPAGHDEYDANFDKTMAVYRGEVVVDVQRQPGGAALATLDVGWQGCADGGLCYSPDSAQLRWASKRAGAATDSVQVQWASADDAAALSAAQTASGGALSSAAAQPSSSPAPVPTSVAATPQVPTAKSPVSPVQRAQAAPDSIAAVLASGSWFKTLGAFFLAGLLLALTPCVLPMVPILSSLIAGQGATLSRSKGFALALAYSLGMALIYAAFGVAAGLAGEGLAAALQNPWVLSSFALLLAALSLSMFGFYELQMPSFIQSRATEWSNRFQGGSLIGVFLMGGVSALVVGPCVAAPLAGALVYISQTRDVLLGGSALFTMAMGMSVPLLLVGLSAGSLLPRVGAWMEQVKKVFGMMLLGVAIWMVMPVLPMFAQMLLWAAWLITAAALLGLFSPQHHQHPHARGPVVARASATALASLAFVLVLGAASGGRSLLQPLAHLAGAGTAQAATPGAAQAGLAFERVADSAALDAALARAAQSGQRVMLDFYADWCVSCKEYENFTFSDAKVQARLKGVKLLQADVTANNAADKALLKRFGLFGPPGLIFFNPAQGTQPVHEVIGYEPPADFLASLAQAGLV